jgi:signal peptidase
LKKGRHSRPARPLLYKVLLVVVVVVGIAVVAGQVGLIGFRALTVQSGSMEPAIGRHSVVVVTQATSLAVGDVITFEHAEEPDILITHRIVDVTGAGDNAVYTTKGDGNDDVDLDPVPAQSVVGKVRFSIPWIGLAVTWTRTDLGFIVLIIIPATLIVHQEILNLRQQYRDRAAKRAGRPA